MPDFDTAKRAALMSDLLNLFQGRPVDLLPFNEVKEVLRLKQVVDRGVQEIPLDRIVGTVGREHEFNRAFLPRDESLRDRWEEVKDLAEGLKGFPPIEVYYVHDVYFVVDGHHRVSVARAVGAETIEAHVKEFVSAIPLSAETSIEEVILRTGLAGFLEATGLTQEYPDEFVVTVPNGYERLLEHISVHRYYRGIEMKRPVPWDEAVQSWRDTVYRPMIETIRKHNVLSEFPGYTETDLYLFTMDHLHHLRKQYGDETKPERAVKHFSMVNRPESSISEKVRNWWHDSKIKKKKGKRKNEESE
jgi:hypothetical protein